MREKSNTTRVAGRV